MSKKNSDFVQLYRNNIDVLRKISHNPTAVDILTIVMKHMDSKNHLVITIKFLCKMTGKGKTAVYSAIKLLKEKKIIGVTNTGGTCLFNCNSNFAWTSYAGSREKYAKMQAIVLVDESEFPDAELHIDKRRGMVVNTKTGEM